MADVTVIAPNAVELVGTIVRSGNAPSPAKPDFRRFEALREKDAQQQAARTPARARLKNPLPTPSNDTAPDKKASNEPSPNRFQNADFQNPSTPFLTQKIAQESALRAQTITRLDRAISAYQQTLANGGDERSRVAFVTRQLDLRV